MRFSLIPKLKQYGTSSKRSITPSDSLGSRTNSANILMCSSLLFSLLNLEKLQNFHSESLSASLGSCLMRSNSKVNRLLLESRHSNWKRSVCLATASSASCILLIWVILFTFWNFKLLSEFFILFAELCGTLGKCSRRELTKSVSKFEFPNFWKLIQLSRSAESGAHQTPKRLQQSSGGQPGRRLACFE